MGNVIPEIKLRLWNALYEAMKKYYSTLQGRAKLITDNDKLKTQNEELRILLHQYVTSEVNKELQIPPSKVLNIDS
jgi:dynein regulatory complex protein 1